MYPISILPDAGVQPGREAPPRFAEMLRRLRARLTAAANAAAERNDNELPRGYFRFPPF